MTDDPNNNANAAANRIVQEDMRWKSKHGEDIHAGMIRGVENQMTRSDPNHVTGSECLSQVELAQRITRPDDNGRTENDALANADEATWRRWRDSQPNRRRRIQQAGG